MSSAVDFAIRTAALLSVSTAIASAQLPAPARSSVLQVSALEVVGSTSTIGSLGELRGSVVDPSGAVVANCPIEIEVLGPESIRHLSSAADGTFLVHAMKGEVKVSVDCEGFNPQTRIVTVTPGIRSVTFHLQIATVNETVEVGKSDLGVDLDQAATQEAETLSADSIAVLPVLDQDYIAFMSRFIDPSVTGAQGTSLVVNGVEGGNFYQAPNAIKSLQVNQDQYSPAFASAGRGRLSLITSSGTDHLHGSLSFALRDYVFDATQCFSPIKPPENREDYQSTLTGPVGSRRHLHFAISGQMKKDDAFGIVNAITPSGNLTLASPTPFYRDKVGGSLYFDDGSGKQWVFGLGRTDQVYHNGSVGGLNLPSIADSNEYTGHFLDLQRTDLLTNRTLNQVRIALGQEGVSTTDATSEPQVNVAGAFVSGSEQGVHSYKQYILSGNELVSIGNAKNTLRMGFDIPELSLHTDNDQTDREGIYSYPSLAAYEAGQPDIFTITQGNGTVRFVSLSTALFVEDTRQFSNHATLMVGARYYFQNIYHNRATHVAPRGRVREGLRQAVSHCYSSRSRHLLRSNPDDRIC